MRKRLEELVDSFNHKKAVLFDFDGTLVHTGHIWREADKAFIKSNGVLIPENYDEVFKEFLKNNHTAGKSIVEVMQQFFEEIFQIKGKDNLEFRAKFVSEEYAKLIMHEGSIDFMKALKDKGLKLGLVTTAMIGYIEGFLENNKEFTDLIDGMVTYEDVGRDGLKPKPTPYLRICEKLEVTPDEAIAFEDSREGVNSAKAAGVKVACICCHPEKEILCDGTLGADCKCDFGADFEFKNYVEILDSMEI